MENIELNNKIDQMNNLIELHLHLDGALSIDNCKKIAMLQNIDIPNDDELLKIMTVPEGCHDLNELLTKFKFPLSLLQTSEGIKNAIINLEEELIEQGIVYAEIRFAPQLHTNKGLTQEEIVKSAIEGLNSSKLKSNLILCCMRGDNNHDKNIETINIAKKYLNKGVCAIDLAGPEAIYPTASFKDLFNYAKGLGVPYTIHAGEADGPGSVYDAISFGTKRIGHGVRSIEDSNIVNIIKEQDITLEVCPTSNICTAIYNKIEELPIKEFMDNDIKVTINTDDPSICNTNLKTELKLVANAFNLTYDDVLKFQLNAINASFASKEVKKEIIKQIG